MPVVDRPSTGLLWVKKSEAHGFARVVFKGYRPPPEQMEDDRRSPRSLAFDWLREQADLHDGVLGWKTRWPVSSRRGSG